MGSMFSKPKAVKAPAPPPPAAMPESSPDTGDEAAKKIRKQQGFEKQILAGSLTPNTGKKQKLGY